MLYILSVSACNIDQLEFQNVELETYRAEHASSLGFFSYTAEQLFVDAGMAEELEIDGENGLSLVYRDTAEYSNIIDLVNINDIVNSEAINLPIANAPAELLEIPLSEEITMEYQPENDEAVDSVVHESGELVLEISSNLGNPDLIIIYDFKIENTVNSVTDQPVQFTGSFPSNSPQTQEQDLSGYSSFFENIDNKNLFSLLFESTLILPIGSEIPLNSYLDFTLTYQNQVFSEVYGFFGQDTLEVSNQIVNTDFFSELSSGIEFENPMISLTFENSYGVPFSTDFSSIYGVSESEVNNLSGDITENIQFIEGPTVQNYHLNGSIDLVETSSVMITSSNSNIRDLISSSPSEIGFNITAYTNPIDESRRNYITNQASIKTFFEMILPMSLQLNDVTRSKDFSYESLPVEDLDSGFLHINTSNGLPLYVSLKIQIRSDDLVIHEVPDNLVLATPYINTDGSIAEPIENTTDIILGKAGLDSLKSGNNINLLMTFNTPKTLNNQDIYVKILADQQVVVNLGIGGRFDKNLNF